MKVEVLTSGYVSMDHIIKLKTPAKTGFTSLVANRSNVGIFYGGCSVNIAYALCRLGIVSMPLIRVGSDYTSNGFKKFLEDGGVPQTGIKVIENEATSICYLLQDNNNDHITIFYPGAMDEKYASPMDDKWFEGIKLGVITVAPRADNMEFFSKCKAHGIPIVFGMKDDMDAFPKNFLKEILLESSIIFANEAEKKTIEEVCGFSHISELFELGKVKILVTTCGKNGSVCHLREEGEIKSHTIQVFKVEEIVDATGSGDAYMSGFIYGYLKGYDAVRCCRLGAVNASFVIQAEGCCTNIPAEDELLRAFEEFEAEYRKQEEI